MTEPTEANNQSAKGTIVIAGAGSIGTALAIVFADSGFAVDLVEPNDDRRRLLDAEIERRHRTMKQAGLARSTATATAARITIVDVLEQAASKPDMVVEAGPEDLDAKRVLFAALAAHTDHDAPIATTSSAIPASEIAADPDVARRALCAHCVNPPTIVRLIECVPAPATDMDMTDKAADLFERAGFQPVRLHKEIPGFVLNRLQGAILREAYRLVDEGVISVADLDRVMTEGLGPRWALSGPFETAELNTPDGIKGHAKRMGPAYRAMGENRGEADCIWPIELVDLVDRQRRAIIGLDELPARRAWREEALAALLAARAAIVKALAPKAKGRKSS